MLKAILIIGIIAVGSILFGLGVYVGHSKNETKKENSDLTEKTTSDMPIPEELIKEIYKSISEDTAAHKATTLNDIKENLNDVI